MRFEFRNGRRYAQFERLAELRELAHAFSTRGDNVSLREDGLAIERAERRSRMACDWGLDPRRLCACEQVHRPELAIVERDGPSGRLDGIDAVVTDDPGRPLMVFSADCPLVLVVDVGRMALGLAHASWRCTVGEISIRLVTTLVERYGCRPRDLLAGIGPSAGPCRYEVGEDVYEAARDLPDRDACFPRHDGRMMFDLWSANRGQLERAGVPPGNIEVAGICTIHDHERFYSFRREGAGVGHFGLIAGLTPT